MKIKCLIVDGRHELKPIEFRNELIIEIEKNAGDLSKLLKYLKCSTGMNFHKYGKELFEVLITGDLLNSDGTLFPNITQTATNCCVVKANNAEGHAKVY